MTLAELRSIGRAIGADRTTAGAPIHILKSNELEAEGLNGRATTGRYGDPARIELLLPRRRRSEAIATYLHELAHVWSSEAGHGLVFAGIYAALCARARALAGVESIDVLKYYEVQHVPGDKDAAIAAAEAFGRRVALLPSVPAIAGEAARRFGE